MPEKENKDLQIQQEKTTLRTVFCPKCADEQNPKHFLVDKDEKWVVCPDCGFKFEVQH